MNKEEFIKACSKINIKITSKILNDLEKYYNILIEWNKNINLTGIIQKEEVYLKHFYDSLCLIKSVNLNEKLYICDVGSGAGFPGLVLKIVFKNLNMVLLEPIGKRCKFLEDVIKNLKIKNIIVINERAEDYAKINREKFDIVTCRAVSHLKIISEISIPMLKVNGLFLPLKSNVEQELIESKKILNELDSKINEIIEYELPIENSARKIIKILKIKETNLKYPRNYSIIKKKLIEK